jgi:hypothetical protein
VICFDRPSRSVVVQAEVETMECECCGGEMMLLGVLGSLSHFRCRNCGMEASCEVERSEYEDHPLEASDFDFDMGE